MNRPFAALLLALTLGFASPLHAGGLPAQLKSMATLDGDIIRLGDLWDNLDEGKANQVITAAPQPGRRVTLDSHWLMAVANANGVEWRPANPYERIVVERAGQTVDPATIEREIREALALEGLQQGSGFEITNRAALAIVIPAGPPPSVAVRDLQIDPRTQRFSALVEVPAGSPSAVRLKVNGRTFTVARIPVLSHNMARGDVIGEKDIGWVDLRDENMKRDIALDPHQLIGQEPRYQIRSGQPVRIAELQRPILVQRNSNVTMYLKTRFMTLSAQGKALDDGGKGDTIKVTNLQTKQTVEGKVEGAGIVSVNVGGAALSN